MDSTTSQKDVNNKKIRSWGMLLDLQHFGVEGHVGALGWGLGKVTSKSITHTDLYKLKNKLVST